VKMPKNRVFGFLNRVFGLSNRVFELLERIFSDLNEISWFFYRVFAKKFRFLRYFHLKIKEFLVKNRV